jgi:hypothetical protein|tara:strand:+ start:4030 stop:4416 length:387 start_codon:yes stop_codon:yes gene_type:complete
MTLISLILVLIQIESGGDNLAVGDNGLAYGCLQMHKAYVQDAAEYAGRDWKHEDAFDRETSIDIFIAYASRYATEERIGRPVSLQDIARIHHGGPNGWKKESTIEYWKRARALLVEEKTPLLIAECID